MNYSISQLRCLLTPCNQEARGADDCSLVRDKLWFKCIWCLGGWMDCPLGKTFRVVPGVGVKWQCAWHLGVFPSGSGRFSLFTRTIWLFHWLPKIAHNLAWLQMISKTNRCFQISSEESKCDEMSGTEFTWFNNCSNDFNKIHNISKHRIWSAQYVKRVQVALSESKHFRITSIHFNMFDLFQSSPSDTREAIRTPLPRFPDPALVCSVGALSLLLSLQAT
jgi:hypothetical protein